MKKKKQEAGKISKESLKRAVEEFEARLKLECKLEGEKPRLIFDDEDHRVYVDKIEGVEYLNQNEYAMHNDSYGQKVGGYVRDGKIPVYMDENRRAWIDKNFPFPIDLKPGRPRKYPKK